jgi:hypothetical protein
MEMMEEQPLSDQIRCCWSPSLGRATITGSCPSRLTIGPAHHPHPDRDDLPELRGLG